MSRSRDERFRRIVSGSERGAAASVSRALLAAAELPYRAITSIRNKLYDDRVLRAAQADCAVICIGNLTTGGTGKTPVVCWLARELHRAGKQPAVLTRGYRSGASDDADEVKLLRRLLGASIPVHADADRVAGARAIRRQHPQTDVIVLDDGFQHRRLHRDFDLVLLDATNPFGFCHVLPRGTLRESPRGLARAHAVLVTHIEAVSHNELARIETRVRDCNPHAPVYHARHEPQTSMVASRHAFVFCGIGNPQAFESAIARVATITGTARFDDHHRYTLNDLHNLESEAKQAGAEVMVTTAKDWVKLESIHPGGEIRIVPIDLELSFERDDAQRLLAQVRSAL